MPFIVGVRGGFGLFWFSRVRSKWWLWPVSYSFL